MLFFFPKGIKVVSGSKLNERKRPVEREIGQSRSKLLAEWNRNIPINYRSTKRLQKDSSRYSDPLSSLNSCIHVLNDLPKTIYTSATNQKKKRERETEKAGESVFKESPRLRFQCLTLLACPICQRARKVFHGNKSRWAFLTLAWLKWAPEQLPDFQKLKCSQRSKPARKIIGHL